MIEVLQVQSELAQMTRLYMQAKPERVLEIGTWEGGTLRVWLRHAAPAATVVAVDLRHRKRARYEQWRQSDTCLYVVTGSSQEQQTMRDIRDYAPYDWAFVDGDHDSEAVRSDVALCLPLIRDGGHLLLHDVYPPDGDDSYPPGDLFEDLLTVGLEGYYIGQPGGSDVAHGIGVVKL